MKEVGIDKVKRLVAALDKAVEVGEAAMADGKIDFADAMLLPSIAPILTDLYSVWENKDELIEQLKDVDWSELREIIKEVE